MTWLEESLEASLDTDVKFIITSHIYESSAYLKNFAYKNWKQDANFDKFIDLLKNYSEKILFEAAGHDHLTGIRFENGEDKQYLNKILFPAISPNNYTQPTYSTFTYDTDAYKFNQLKFTSLKVTSTQGLPKTSTYEDFDFFEVDWSGKFGF